MAGTLEVQYMDKVDLVLFTAEWCSPCKGLKQWIDSNYSGQVRVVDVSEESDLVRQCRVGSVPTLVVGDKSYVGSAPIKSFLGEQ